MKKFVLLISILIFVSLTHCRKGYITVDDCVEYDYSDCITTKYSTAFIYLNFSLSDKIQKIPFELYKGNIDDGELILRDTSSSKEFTLEGEFDVYYSVKAKYQNGENSYYVIDGGEAKRWSQKVCDSTCWHYEDLELDLSLEY